MTTITAEQFLSIHADAIQKAREASGDYYQVNLGGRDNFPCGFAWVKVFKVRSNSKLGKAMVSVGFEKSYTGGLSLWNPSQYNCQNVNTLAAGARAYAKVLQDNGIEAYSDSRLD